MREDHGRQGDIPGLGWGTRGRTEGAERQGGLIMVTLSFARTPSLSRERTEGLGMPVPLGPHPCPALNPPLPISGNLSANQPPRQGKNSFLLLF